MNSLFRVSERNHFGLIFMTQLAKLPEGSFLSVKEASEDMKMPLGYLEEIAGLLKTAELIQGRQGPGGGYKLAKPAEVVTAQEIVEALEGPVAMVACMDGGCPVEGKCHSKKLWGFLQKNILQTLKDTRLSEITV
ncbi:Rrf2 family transcriptional regulator [Patescibacteria group bacterium]|jgi:Rrf2 family protein|nr:Rrf2 family transcriptional regulator [Patescibacteria group bacterium]